MGMLEDILIKSINGKGDSDRHLMTLFSIALATKGKNYIELGVRKGDTTVPLAEAARINDGVLYSVDIVGPPEIKASNWHFHKKDAVEFLLYWEALNFPAPDFVYIDDWHSYEHVKKELEILDRIVAPKTVVVLHDLMYGNTAPYYHSDITLKDGQWANGGPYRAVAELDPQFWEFCTLPWSHGLTILRKKYSNRETTV
jgi:predicted O-methyltransferase YrrM